MCELEVQIFLSIIALDLAIVFEICSTKVFWLDFEAPLKESYAL